MERIYILDELDCANCAMKIEKHVSKISGVRECSVDFVSKKMFVDMEHAGIEDIVRDTVAAIEPDVTLRCRKQGNNRKTAAVEAVHDYEHKQEEHTHSHGDHDTCGHDHAQEGHEHSHNQNGCSCTHSHGAEHHHEDCGCGHHQEAHEDREIQGAVKLYVKNLDCANCANKIEAYVQKMENVKDASMNFSGGVLFVELQDSARRKETITEIINHTGGWRCCRNGKGAGRRKAVPYVLLSGKCPSVFGNPFVCGSNRV